MKAEIKDGQLIITMPLQTPTPSASGKTLLVATGTLKNAVVLNGKPVTIQVNAYVKP